MVGRRGITGGLIACALAAGGCDAGEAQSRRQPAARATPHGTITRTPAAKAASPAGGGGATLPDGEYACYGSGGTVLAGLGFKVRGGRYTDLDGGNPGTVAVGGRRVTFTGGHMSDLGGGRDYDGRHFRVGSMASCEPW